MYRTASSFLILLSQAVACVLAATVSYDWEVTWVNAAPDGFSRPVIGINGQWPCPPIYANVGDTVVVNLKNSLGNQTTGLHFHGIRQVNTNFMDGASMVSQCPVIPGLSIKYEFVVNEPGTFWYHSHNMGQYPDGLRGPLIVHDPHDPYCEDYDEEVIITVTDWYHSLTLPLAQQMLLPSNTNFQPPIPDGFLVNEGKDFNIAFKVDKTYRVRIISFAALASFMINFDSHTMDVVMTDGSYVQKQEVDTLRVAPAQRYDFLITSEKGDEGKNFPFLVAMDVNRDFATPDAVWVANKTGYLITDPGLPTQGDDVLDVFQPFDEGDYAPLRKKHALGPVSKTWELNFGFCRDVNNYTRTCLNDKTYIPQKVPTLYSAATMGDPNSDPTLYGAVQAFVVGYGDVVEIVINNLDEAIHPFHLHGHQFQILEHPPSGAGKWNGNTNTAKTIPPTRDVLTVHGNSYVVLRIVADNPGVFLIHCHIEWHVEMGSSATLIEAPEKLHGYPIPQDHIDACNQADIPVAGNAGGNTDNVQDTSGFNTVPPLQYYGATWPVPTSPKKTRVVRRSMRGRAWMP